MWTLFLWQIPGGHAMNQYSISRAFVFSSVFGFGCALLPPRNRAALILSTMFLVLNLLITPRRAVGWY
jgi:hypothetical protein